MTSIDELALKIRGELGYQHIPANQVLDIGYRLAAELGRQEPVAWRCRHSEQEKWHLFDSPKGWWERQPLYTSPPLAPECVKDAVMVERNLIECVIEWLEPAIDDPDMHIGASAARSCLEAKLANIDAAMREREEP